MYNVICFNINSEQAELTQTPRGTTVGTYPTCICNLKMGKYCISNNKLKTSYLYLLIHKVINVRICRLFGRGC